jgi:hypothetical protein
MSDQPPGSSPPPLFPPPFQPPPPMYPPGSPGQVPPPYMPIAAAGAGLSLTSQFGGDALWSIALGLVSIVVPFFFNEILFFLPLIGLFYGIRAIRRGRMIGGIVGIVLCALGGIITVIGLVGG